MPTTTYQSGECIFEGAASRVYRATRDDGTPVVIKQLRELYPSPAKLARFAREFEITRSAAGEGVIQAYELREEQGSLSIVLDDFGAVSVAEVLREGRLPLVDALRIALQVSTALARIHRLDVVHKDVNPANCVWNRATGVVRLIDFGISQVLSREAQSHRAKDFEGTPRYMSPEQTGRMNRAVDCRSDLYSLGAMLYEMVTGQAPFDADDPLQLMHAHIAKRPAAPSSVDPEVPVTVSRIVETLLEKRAEDRYQSASGLAHDLSRCLEELEATGSVSEFPLRERDVEERLRIPQKLYGRAAEVERLLTAFEQAAAGATRVLLVGGYSGIGKTSFVHEVQRSLAARRGRFVEGKFDQFNRGTPYDSLIQAFRELTRQTLAGSPESIRSWRERVLAAVGTNGRVLTDVIPEAEHLIGEQPAVEELSPTEARNRFHLVLGAFVRAMASPEQPLVIFLDDLQWTDLPSIGLITSLASDPEIRHLLWIGAYRDNEVDESHPLTTAMAELRARAVAVEQVSLGPLGETDVIELVRDTVLGAEGHARLALACHDKTGGNAFFLNRFLEALHQDGALRFDAGAGAWTWDLARIRAQTVTANVVEFMSGQIRRLPEPTQRSLELAACIGNGFDLRTLSWLRGATRKDTLEALKPALGAELVVPAEDGFWYVEEVDEATTNFSYRFVHDRVRQSAYVQLGEDQAAQVHQRIGELMLEQLDDAEQRVRLFELVEHLNRGVPPGDQDVRDRLCDLNLAAGRRAASSAAFQPAHVYLQAAHAALGEDGWERRYEQALAIHVEGARAAHLSGDTATMEARVAAAIEHGRELLDRVTAQEVRIYALVSQQRLLEAIQQALQVLQQLGVEYPLDPTPAQVEAAIGETLGLLDPETLETVWQRPVVQDPAVVAIRRIQNGIMSSAYLVKPNLLALMACHVVRSTVTRGPCGQSAYGFTVFALVLTCIDQIDTAYRIGKVARELLDRLSDRSEAPRVHHVLTMMVDPWVEPQRACLEQEARLVQQALDTGDLEYAGWSMHVAGCNGFYAGVDLPSLRQRIDRHIGLMQRHQLLPALACTLPFRQAIDNLSGAAEDPARLLGEHWDEEAQAAALQEIDFRGALLVMHTLSTYLRFLFRELDSAQEWLQRGARFYDGAQGTPNVLAMDQLRALLTLQRCAEGSAAEHAEELAGIEGSIRQLETWRRFSPSNHDHRVALVQAELARVEGRPGDATLLYDEAIAAARANRFSQDEALGNELAGRFHLARGSKAAARGYLLEACYGYARWGAAAKTAQLEEEFAQLLAGAQLAARPGRTPRRGTRTATQGAELDLGTLFKAASAISSQIHLEDLLAEITQVVIENAGATHGFLFLDEEGALQVGVAQDAEGQALVAAGTALEACEQLPGRVATYVARTGDWLVVDDAREDARWAALVPADRPTSVLCGPVVHQGRRLGIVYLENRLTAGAFTPARIELMTLLSAQAAISIENARVYEVLEDTVAARTQELRERNAELEHELQVARDLVHDAHQRHKGYLLGQSPAVVELRADIQAASRSSLPVLITSSGGAGEEAVARAIHHQSARSGNAFIFVDCLALGSDGMAMSESEAQPLFGPGGKWELARRGSIYFYGVGSLSPELQQRLARELAGEDPHRPRVITYDRDRLSSDVGTARWSRVLDESSEWTKIRVPPLADRKEDLPALVDFFLNRKAARLGRTVEGLTHESMARILSYPWPGNLDELRSVMECALLASKGPQVEIDEALLDAGRRIGNYQLVQRIGSGGMGEVWLAKHRLLVRPAAVKLIQPTRLIEPKRRASVLGRFEREARITASLESPNTVRLYDFGLTDEGDLFYVMELLWGLDLEDLVAGYGSLPPARAVNLIQQACGSLAEAHRAGLVHRDIKPANLFACRLGLEYDFLKVLDFGLVRAAAELAEQASQGFVGTVTYASPEGAQGHPVDQRSDIYSLGCVLYWLLTGSLVFPEPSSSDVLRAHAGRAPQPPSRRCDQEIPPELDAVVLACLAKDPADRPQTADELRERLRALDLPEPWTPRDAEAWWVANPPESPLPGRPEASETRLFKARSWLADPPSWEHQTRFMSPNTPPQDEATVRVEAEALPDYLERCRLDLLAMGIDLQTGDLPAVKRRAHAMREESASYGFKGLTELATEMAAAAEAGDGDAVSWRLATLRKHLTEITENVSRIQPPD